MTAKPSYDRDELAGLIGELAVARGQVTLSSGATSDHYFDLRRVSLHPRGFELVGQAIWAETQDWKYDAVAGLVLGAVPLALATMSAARAWGRHVPSAAIRKEPKKHGLGKRVEGVSLSGKQVLIVEDTSTTGSSTSEAIKAVGSEGANVAGVVLLVDRGGAGHIATGGVPVRSVFTASELLAK